MPTLRRKLEYTSDQGIDYEVYIDDTNYASTTFSSTIGASGAVINWPIQTKNSPFITRYIPSECTVPFKKQNASDDSVQSDIRGAAEQRFKVRVDRDGSLFWTGFILPDSIQAKDEYYPSEFSVKAVDGLGLLKTIDYNNSGTKYTGRATIMEHIFNCLEKIPLDYFYASTEEFLKVTVNWYEDQHVVVSTLNPLTVTNCDHDAFYSLDSKGNIKYKNCLEVLEYCLQLFGGYIIQSGGVWRIIQYNERENAVFTEFIYDIDRTHLSTDTGATYEEVTTGTGQTLPRRLTGGYFSDYQALNKVTLQYNHNTAKNLLSGAAFNYSTALDNQGDLTVGNIDVDGEEQILLKGTINFKCYWLIPQNQDTYRHEWKVKLKVGNKYLRRDIINNGFTFSYTTITWEDAESWYYVSTPNLYQAGTTTPSTTFESSISFFLTTPNLQEEGDIIFDLFWHQCVGIDDQVYATNIVNTNFYLEYDLVAKVMNLLHDGEQANMETSRLYSVTNDATGNSTLIELETVLGDGPYRVTSNRLKVYDGSNYVISDDWKVDDAGTGYEIQELLIRQILAAQKTGAGKYSGSIKGNVFPHTRIQIDSDYYLFEGGTYLTNADILQGTWFEISTDDTGATTGPAEPQGPTQTEIPGAQGFVSNPGGDPDPGAVTGIQTQSPGLTTEPIVTGYVDIVWVPGVDLTQFAAGDSVKIVDPSTGNSDTVIIAATPTATDDSLQIEPTYISGGYQSGASLIPVPSEAVPENQASGEVVSEFFTNGEIDKEDYYFKTEILLSKHFILVGASIELLVAPTDFMFRVPTSMDNTQIESIFMGVATAGSGGSTTIDLKLNGSTINTSTITTGNTYVNDELTTFEDLSEGDILTAEIATVPSTPPFGLDMSLGIGKQQIYLDKLTYQFNRVETENLQLWHRYNYAARAAINSGSLIFADNDEYINCGNDSSLDITGSVTISAWVKFSNLSSATDVVAGRRYSLKGFELARGSEFIAFYLENQTGCFFDSTGLMEEDKWYHLTGWSDGTDIKIYLDGVEKDTAAVASALTVGATDFAIGASDNGGSPFSYFEGNIAMVRLWSRALTIDEIQSIMEKPYIRLTASEKVDLVSSWEMDDTTATTVPDGHGDNDGTVT